MPFEISTDTPPALLPVAWMVGRWEGAGVGGYPTTQEFRFGQEVEFAVPEGKAYLTYTSQTWLLDDDGARLEALAAETGYWRPQADGGLEVVMAHPMGYVEIWVGRVDGAKIELRTDLVARTESAKEYSAGHRLYGLVEGDLMWAYDMAAVGQPLQPHASARLKRVG